MIEDLIYQAKHRLSVAKAHHKKAATKKSLEYLRKCEEELRGLYDAKATGGALPNVTNAIGRPRIAGSEISKIKRRIASNERRYMRYGSATTLTTIKRLEEQLSQLLQELMSKELEGITPT